MNKIRIYVPNNYQFTSIWLLFPNGKIEYFHDKTRFEGTNKWRKSFRTKENFKKSQRELQRCKFKWVGSL